MGGRVGLKGTDSKEILERARQLKATPLSASRTVEALKVLVQSTEDFELVTYPHEMGEKESIDAGISPRVIGSIEKGQTTAEDTQNAAEDMLREQVAIVLFAGGDGTARDVCGVIDQKVAALGIPTGVKVHSSVFALNPRAAGELTVAFLKDQTTLTEREVMDIDEEAFRHDRVSAQLFGYLKVPFKKRLIQPSKSGSPSTSNEKMQQREIAEYVVKTMNDCYYFLGPGTTTRAIGEILDIDKTLLGVDVIQNGSLVYKDANEQVLLDYAKKGCTKIVVTPIGGQGFVFGRGNQQFSPEVIKSVGRENILVIATPSKLSSVGISEPLRVDTGNSAVDELLRGYLRVIVGHSEERVLRLE